MTVRILDGATGTELDRLGVDVTIPLWSAGAVETQPDAVRRVHDAYLEAGADLVTTATFRTTARTLRRAGRDDDEAALAAITLTARAVQLAREACARAPHDAQVLGSVAPLEDCYRPDLAPDAETCRAEHAEQILHLVAAGVDGVLIETMNNLAETRAAVEAARELAPGRWMVCLCTRSEGPPGILLSGEPIERLLEELGDAGGVGVNCVAAPSVEAQVTLLRSRLPAGVPVIAYANIGYADDAGNWIATDAVSPARYAEYAARWLDAGAEIVGGCCGTTPEHIRACAAIRDR